MTATLAATETRHPNEETPSLIVEVTATVTCEQKVDLIKVFTSLSEKAQRQYLALDLGAVGFTEEWERPLAFLWPEEDDLIPLSMCPGDSHPFGSIDEADIRLHTRAGTRVFGREAAWTADDHARLVAAVPWLREHHRRLNLSLSPEDTARMPGPNDDPLF